MSRILIFLIDVDLSGSARRSDGAKVFTNDQKRIPRHESHAGTVLILGGTHQIRGLEHIVWILGSRKRRSEQMYGSDTSLRRPARLVGSGGARAYSDRAGGQHRADIVVCSRPITFEPWGWEQLIGKSLSGENRSSIEEALCAVEDDQVRNGIAGDIA